MKKVSLLTITTIVSLSFVSPAFAADETPEQVMAELDTDKSGTLSKAEAKPHKRVTKRFDRADKDEDGQLNMKELKRALGGGKKKKAE
ncbi:MAG: hypothetical protein ACPGN3_13735 [Opitutales bacterium]